MRMEKFSISNASLLELIDLVRVRDSSRLSEVELLLVRLEFEKGKLVLLHGSHWNHC